MLSKKDIALLFERFDRMEAYMTVKFKEVDDRFVQMQGQIDTLKAGLASVQDVVLQTNSYIEGELRVYLHRLDDKDGELETRIVKLEKKRTNSKALA